MICLRSLSFLLFEPINCWLFLFLFNDDESYLYLYLYLYYKHFPYFILIVHVATLY